MALCFLLVFNAGWSSHYWITKHIQDGETSSFCQNKKYRTAWLAKKEGTYRCFQEMNEYPNRAFGYDIPTEQENYYPTPFHIIQGQLRFDLWEENTTS